MECLSISSSLSVDNTSKLATVQQAAVYTKMAIFIYQVQTLKNELIVNVSIDRIRAGFILVALQFSYFSRADNLSYSCVRLGKLISGAQFTI